MIVCSCNVLTDDDVRSALTRIVGPRTVGQVYGSLGCRAQCGCCARTIRQIIDAAPATDHPTRHCHSNESNAFDELSFSELHGK
jgi:bacterioferritin-associated ferredoxin